MYMTKKIKSITSLALAMSCFSALALASEGQAPQDKITVKVDTNPQQEMTFGMDFERLWSWNLSPEEAKKLAEQSVKDCKVDYVRVAIDGAAEFEEGKTNWDYYNKQLEMMNAMKEANPNIKFFASPRPIHEAVKAVMGKKAPPREIIPFSCFPLWIGEFNHPFEKKGRKMVAFHWDKAADFMVRQIKFLQDKGFNIAYMDIKNENDRYYFPAELSKMTDSIRKQMGDKMPKVIGPSSYDRGGCVDWLNKAIEINRTDFFDIISSHNTKETNTYQELTDMAKKLNKPLWNTELHAFQGPDAEAAMRTQVLWKHIRAGFGGLNDWLSLGNAKKQHKMFRNVEGKIETMRTYYIFKQLVNNANGGNYHETNIPTEINMTAAFVKGDTLTVWIQNTNTVPPPAPKAKKSQTTGKKSKKKNDAPTETVPFSPDAEEGEHSVSKVEDIKVLKVAKDLKNVEISFEGWQSATDEIEVMYWGPSNPREGTSEKIKISEGASSFVMPELKADTLYCFTIKIKK